MKIFYLCVILIVSIALFQGFKIWDYKAISLPIPKNDFIPSSSPFKYIITTSTPNNVWPESQPVIKVPQQKNQSCYYLNSGMICP